MPRSILFIILSVQFLALSMVVSYWYYDNVQRNKAYHECLAMVERVSKQQTQSYRLPDCYYR